MRVAQQGDRESLPFLSLSRSRKASQGGADASQTYCNVYIIEFQSFSMLSTTCVCSLLSIAGSTYSSCPQKAPQPTQAEHSCAGELNALIIGQLRPVRAPWTAPALLRRSEPKVQNPKSEEHINDAMPPLLALHRGTRLNDWPRYVTTITTTRVLPYQSAPTKRTLTEEPQHGQQLTRSAPLIIELTL